MKFPVFDLHCDTALAMLPLGWSKGGQLRCNALHLDLNRANFPGYCQCFACFTTPEMESWYHKKPVDVFEMELAMILSQIQQNPDKIAQAFSAGDIEANREKGIASAVLTIEGPAGFGYDPALLEDLWQIGFRISTLGWNESNVLAGSHATGEGLTDRGREYVQECQRLGMLVDVSHLSDHGFWDIMEITRAPVVATHSNSRALCPHSRNLSDDMFRAICQTGGVAGLNVYTDFLGNAPTLDTACDHIFHWLELDPEGKHIALGGDLDGCESLPLGFDGVQSYPALAQRLLERGAGEKIVESIFWNNAMGVFNNAVRHNEK
jgi:membrane dipeptidase